MSINKNEKTDSAPSTGLNPTRSAYVPPHARKAASAVPVAPPIDTSSTQPPTATSTGRPLGRLNGSGGTYESPAARAGFGAGSRTGSGWGASPSSRGASGGAERMQDGYGAWKDGKHIQGARHMRMEQELYGSEGDGSHQVSLDLDILALDVTLPASCHTVLIVDIPFFASPPVSTLTDTPTFPSRPPVKEFPTPLPNSPTLLWTLSCSKTSKWLVMSPPHPCKSIPSPSSLMTVI